MRHVGEAEAAIAIGLDRCAAWKMRLADLDSTRHRSGRALVDGARRCFGIILGIHSNAEGV